MCGGNARAGQCQRSSPLPTREVAAAVFDLDRARFWAVRKTSRREVVTRGGGRRRADETEMNKPALAFARKSY